MPNISERIHQFNSNRDPERLPLKYKAMRENPFRFFRGTCHLFYEDLFQKNLCPDSPSTWLCGDLHLENFGSFKGSDRLAYFDLNDFDEAVLGPAWWDMCRLVTSIIIARSDAANSIISSVNLVKQLLETYCATLQTGKAVTIEEETASGLVKELFEKVALRKEKKFIRDRVLVSQGSLKLITDNKKYFPLEKDVPKKELFIAIQKWLNEKHGRNARKIEDLCELVAGTGSIGVKKYLALAGKPSTDKKYLLCIKQALPSSLQPFVTVKQPSWLNEAQRICSLQYRMEHMTPGDLDTFNFRNEWYVTRWLQPLADKINLEDFINERDKQTDLINTFARLAASAQLRSSGRQGSATIDELIKFGANNEWISAVADYAKTYAATVKKDYREYCRDYDKGYFNFNK